MPPILRSAIRSTLMLALAASPLGAQAATSDIQGRGDPACNAPRQPKAAVAPCVRIHDIQGTGRSSPLSNASVRTHGVVTAVTSSGFYLQSLPAQADANPNSSEGIAVFTGVAPPVAAAVGNRVAVAGRVDEFTESSRPDQLSLTRIVAASVTLLSKGHALPAPAAITAADSRSTSDIASLERLEGMRVRVPALTVIAPTDADGDFFAVLAGNARPFRESGRGALDVAPVPYGVTPERFDTNPERLRITSRAQRGARLVTPDAGAVLAAFNGVLDYGMGTYTVLPDPGVEPKVTGGKLPTAVAHPLDDEVTVASFNLQRFHDDVDDAGADDVLSTAAFDTRLYKTAQAVCDYLQAPDILAVMEVENLRALSRLATAINNTTSSGCRRGTDYRPHLLPGNDAANNIGFLVRGAEWSPGKPRVQVEQLDQFGRNAVGVQPDGSRQQVYDHPPLMLRALVNQNDGGTYRVTVIANHLQSLDGVSSTRPGANGWSTEGARVRARRAAQAAHLAGVVQARQLANPSEHLVVLGTFNAFEFNDGYVDTMGIVTGREARSDQVVNHVDSPIATPLTNLTTRANPQDHYSMVSQGNAQALDHVVASAALLDAMPGTRIEHARINADFGVDNFDDPGVPVRVSDRDPVVVFLPLATVLDARLRSLTGGTSSVTAGRPVEWTAFVQNNGPDPASNIRVRFQANFALPTLAVTVANGMTCGAAVVNAAETTLDCTAPALAVQASFQMTVVAQTSASMAGNTVTFSTYVESDTPDSDTSNNLSWHGTQIAIPDTDIGVGFVRNNWTIVDTSDRIDFQVSNFARDAAQSVRVVMTLVSGPAKLTAYAPAGWTCGASTLDGGRVSVECNFAGDFVPGRIDVLSMGLESFRSGTIIVSAGATTPSPEAYTANNFDSRHLTVMVRHIKPPPE